MSKICPNCGKEIEDSVLFCPSCGASVEEKKAAAEMPQTNEAFNAGQQNGPQAGEYNADPQASYGQQGGYQAGPQGVPQGNGYYQPQMDPAGKSQATASLVLGIVGIALMIFGLSLISIITSAIGLVMAGKAKKLGYMDGMRTAGFVINLIVLILCIIMVVACGALFGLIGAGLAGVASEYSGDIDSIIQQILNSN